MDVYLPKAELESRFQSLLSQGISLLLDRIFHPKNVHCSWFQSLLSQGISLLNTPIFS